MPEPTFDELRAAVRGPVMVAGDPDCESRARVT
jgi:hypothetical protein